MSVEDNPFASLVGNPFVVRRPRAAQRRPFERPEPRSHHLRVRITRSEVEQLNAAAARAGVSRSDFLRDVLAQHFADERPSAATLAEVAATLGELIQRIDPSIETGGPPC